MYIAIVSAVVLVALLAAGLIVWRKRRTRPTPETSVAWWRFPAVAGDPEVVFGRILQEQAAHGYIFVPIRDPALWASIIDYANREAKAKGELIQYDAKGDYTFPSGIKVHLRGAKLISAPGGEDA